MQAYAGTCREQIHRRVAEEPHDEEEQIEPPVRIMTQSRERTAATMLETRGEAKCK
jgi:hypothetical protein